MARLAPPFAPFGTYRGAFTTADARRSGVARSRLRARDLRHPFHAIHLSAEPGSIHELCGAYLPRMVEGAWFSHQTAAALLGAPLPALPESDLLLVSVAFPRSAPRGRGVVGHSLGLLRGALVDGLPISLPAQVWCGLEVNRPVHVRTGRLVLHPDLSIPNRRVAFEYEGDGHRIDRRQWHVDIERRELLEAEGWRVVRVTARDLFEDREAFARRLSEFVPNGGAIRAIRHESRR